MIVVIIGRIRSSRWSWCSCRLRPRRWACPGPACIMPVATVVVSRLSAVAVSGVFLLFFPSSAPVLALVSPLALPLFRSVESALLRFLRRSLLGLPSTRLLRLLSSSIVPHFQIGGLLTVLSLPLAYFTVREACRTVGVTVSRIAFR